MSGSEGQNSPIRIIALREADSAAITALFAEQQAELMNRLHWDYSAPGKVVQDLAGRGQLLGFAALCGSSLVGFSFFIAESTRCSIGDIYVSREWRDSGADGQMASAILDTLSRLPRMRRIEFQTPGFGNAAADTVFTGMGFKRFERDFMIADLSGACGTDPVCFTATTSCIGPDVTVRRWREDDFGPSTRVVYESYKGCIDRKINALYGSEEGCGELLSILIDNVWCGSFMPETSLVAIDNSSGKPIGVLVCSAIAADAGHIGQVSVSPSHQGKGVARRMIVQALREFAGRGFGAASLAVTHQNTRALRLYEALGFRSVHSFPVYYRQL